MRSCCDVKIVERVSAVFCEEDRWIHPPVNGGDDEDILKVKLKEIDGGILI